MLELLNPKSIIPIDNDGIVPPWLRNPEFGIYPPIPSDPIPPVPMPDTETQNDE